MENKTVARRVNCFIVCWYVICFCLGSFQLDCWICGRTDARSRPSEEACLPVWVLVWISCSTHWTVLRSTVDLSLHRCMASFRHKMGVNLDGRHHWAPSKPSNCILVLLRSTLPLLFFGCDIVSISQSSALSLISARLLLTASHIHHDIDISIERRWQVQYCTCSFSRSQEEASADAPRRRWYGWLRRIQRLPST